MKTMEVSEGAEKIMEAAEIEPVLITHNGTPTNVMMPYGLYEKMLTFKDSVRNLHGTWIDE